MNQMFLSIDEIKAINNDFDPNGLCEFEIEEVKGILIQEDELDNFLNDQHLKIVDKKPTSYEGIRLVSFKAKPGERPTTVTQEIPPPPPSSSTKTNNNEILAENEGEDVKKAKKEKASKKIESKIHIWDGHGDEVSGMKKYTNDCMLYLADKINKPINIFVPHGSAVKMPDDIDIFTIIIYGYNNDEKLLSNTAPDVMWGKKVASREATMVNPRSGSVGIETPEGDIIGDIKNNSVFIYFDIVHSDDKNSRYILSKIFNLIEEYCLTGKMTKEDLTDYYKELFAEACAKRSDKYINDLKKQYEESMEEVREIRSNLTVAMKKEIDLNKVLTKIDLSGASELKSKFSKEYENILSDKRIKKVTSAEDTLIINTDQINCIDPRTGEIHDIGVFKININLINSSITMENLTRKVNAYREKMNGPHVFPDGQPCLGNASEVIPGLVASLEYHALVMYMMHYLESVNVDDSAGSKIHKWPIVGESAEHYKQRLDLSVSREKAGNTGFFKVAIIDNKVTVDAAWEKDPKRKK